MPDGVDEKTAEAALEKLLSEIQAIPDDKTRRCNVSGTRVVEVGQAVAKRIENDVGKLREIFSNSPDAVITSLVDRALACWAAEKRAAAVDPADAGKRQVLFVEGGALKTLAVKVLDLVASDDDEVVRTLEAVRPGTGYRDRADDLTALYPHLDKRRADLAGRQLMTADQIDRVGSLGTDLLAPQGDQAPELAAARLLHDKAFTYYYQADDTVRRHLEFLYWDNPDGLKAYPKLYQGGRKKS